MKNPDLKPCPLCGGKAISQYIPPHEHHIVDMPPYEGAGSVECLDCECSVIALTEEEAIEKWNKRADEPVRHGQWADEENNEPLTLEELREMNGEPVFVTHNKYGEGWCIIDWHGVNKSWAYFTKTGTAEGMTAVPVTAATYGETWLAYSHKPLEHSEV